MSEDRLGLHPLRLRVVQREEGGNLRTLRFCGPAARFAEEQRAAKKAEERLRVPQREET